MNILSTGLAISGIFLLVAITYQVLINVWTALRQFRADRMHQDLGVELLRRKVESVKALHIANEKLKDLTWTGVRKFKVKTVPEGGGVTSAYLYPHDGKKLPPFKPGQYLTFQLKLPGEEKPLIRCYSLSDGVRDDYYRVSVKKVLPPRDKPELPPGKSSSYFNDVLETGDILDVKAPGGAFFLECREQYPIVLIGGGIGITPVYSMLKTLVDMNSDREIWFFYGVRNSKEMIYVEQLKEIAKTQPNVRMNICFSGPLDEDKEGDDYQHAERVTVDLFKRVLPSNNYEFYICGPPPMMQTLVPDLYDWGVPEKKVNFEAFGPATVKKAKKKEESAEKKEDAPGFKVNFSVSDKVVTWGGQDSILELADDNDISMSSGCRVGNCGTCMVAVKSGEVEYDSAPSFEPDAGTCLVCVAKPKGDIEIDG